MYKVFDFNIHGFKLHSSEIVLTVYKESGNLGYNCTRPLAEWILIGRLYPKRYTQFQNNAYLVYTNHAKSSFGGRILYTKSAFFVGSGYLLATCHQISIHMVRFQIIHVPCKLNKEIGLRKRSGTRAGSH